MNKIYRYVSYVVFATLLFFSQQVSAQNCTVNAGVSESVCPGQPFVLKGKANGLFASGGNATWSQLSGPAVILGSPVVSGNDVTVTVSGYSAGNTYVFRLSARCTDGSPVYQDVTFTTLPATTANAGADIVSCAGTINLAGNAVGSGETGVWTVIGATNGISIANASSPTTAVTLPTTNSGTTTLRWTISNSNSCTSYDEVTVTNRGGVTPVNAGPDQTLSNCFTFTTSTQLAGTYAGTNVGGQQGTWTLISGPNTPSIGNTHLYNTGVSNLVQGTYRFRWTVAGPCVNGYDEVDIIVPAPTQSVTSTPNITQVYCDGRTSAVITAPTPVYTNETLTWAKISGSGTITNVNAPSTTITGLSGSSTTVLTYTVNNSVTGCTNVGTYTISYTTPPTIAPSSTVVIANPDSTNASIPYSFTGGDRTQWALISGPAGSDIQSTYGIGNFTTTSAAPLTLSGFTQIGNYVIRLKRTTNNGQGGCADALVDITVVISKTPTPSNSGTSQFLACNVFTTNLAGNAPSIGTGTWSQVSGPNTATIANINNPTTAVSGLTNGAYVFRWIISANGTSNNQQSDVNVLVASTLPTTANAGLDATICNGTPYQLNGNQPILNETGTWTVSPSAGITFSNVNSKNAIVNGLAANTVYTFTWTIVNACGTSADNVVITTSSSVGAKQATAGADQCLSSGTTTITLAGNAPGSGETGLWTRVSGPNTPTFTSATTYNTTVTGAVNGNYVFEWALTKSGCNTTRDTVVVTISGAATTAAAGSDQTICGATTVTLASNTPTTGTGTWTQVAGPGGATITTPSSASSTVTGLVTGSYTFRWTISNGACSSNYDDVLVIVSAPPSAASAGTDQSLCSGTSTTLAATAVSTGSGLWTVVGGPNTPTFSSFSSNTASISGLVMGTYTLTWTASSGPYCPPSVDTVLINVTQPAVASTPSTSLCNATTASLVGNAGSTGTWSNVSGPNTPTLTPNSSSTAIATGLIPGTYQFRYTMPAVGLCPSTNDVVSITISAPATTANAGADQDICILNSQTTTSVVLAGNTPTVGTGQWTLVSQSGGSTPTFSPNASTPNGTLGNLTAGVYLLQWNITNGNCGSNNDIVRITVSAEPTNANAGPDQLNGCTSSIYLAGNVPTVGVGTWTTVSGPNTPNIDAPNDANTRVVNTTPGTYVFRWTIANGVCSTKTDDVTVVVTSTPPNIANAGVSQTLCNTPGPTSTATLAANAPIAGETGTWSVMSKPSGAPNPTFTNSALYNTQISGLQQGTYALMWTLNNGSCVSTDSMTITVSDPPTTANAGTNQNVCLYTPVTLNATAVTVGTGTWTVASKPGGAQDPVFINANANNTSVTGLVAGTYVFTWTTTNGSCPASTSNVTVTIYTPPTPANAGAYQTVCYGTTVTMAGNQPTTGTGTWSVVSQPSGSPAPVFTAGQYNTTVTNLVEGTYVFQWQIVNGICTSSDNTQITVQPALGNNTITAAQTICNGQVPAALTGSTPTGGNGTTYTYQWQSSTTSGSTGFTNISGAISKDYSPGALTATTWYRRTVTSGACTTPDISSAIQITVQPPISNNTLTAPTPVVFCQSGDPGNIVGAIPTGGDGSTYTYQWQQSTTSASTGFTNISGAVSQDYDPSTLTVSTWFRRVVTSGYCTSTSSAVGITIYPYPTLTSSGTGTVCSGVTYSYSPTSSVSGTTYSWTRATVAGISNAAGSGTGSISEILTNTTNVNVDVTYVYTLTANGCANPTTYNVVVTVKPKPDVTVPSNLVLCNGAATGAMTFSSSVFGTTFNWTNNRTSIGLAASGTGNIATFNAANATTAPVVATITVTPSANSCTGNAANYTITVNPTPVLSSATTASACDGVAFNYTATSATAGTTFSWTRAAVGTNGASSGSSASISETLVNTGTTALTATYVFTLTANGCSNTQNVTVTIYPTATLTSTLTPSAICSGTAFSYTPTSATSGVTFSWTRATVAGISNTAGSGTGNPNETLTNTTDNPVNVTYVYTLSVGGCTNPSSYNVVVTVNPRPALSSTLTPSAICNNTTFSYTPTSNTFNANPSTFTWTRAAIATINSNVAGSGTGSISETLVNSSTAPVVVTYVYTVSANGCSRTQNVTVTVYPNPTLTSTLSPGTICNNATFSYTPTSGTSGTTFAWTRATVSGISNAAGSGTGNPNEALTNTTTDPIVVTYVYTLTANACTNPSTYNVNVTVNPTPVLTSTTSPSAVCSNTPFTYTPTSSTTGATFTWTRATVVGISNISGSGSGAVNETLINTTAAPINVTYVYTVRIGSCANPSTYNVVVTVNPTPTLSSTLTPAAICNNATFTYTATSATSGTTFTWTRAAIATINSNVAGSGSDGNISEVLTNSSTAPVNVVYAMTSSANGCPNTQNVTVSVNPTPVLTSTLTPAAKCNSTVFSYTPTSSTTGATFAWTRAAVAGISNSAGSGSGNPNETLVNTTTEPVVVTYVYTVSINGCANPTTYNVNVTINPTPTLTSTLSPSAICSGTTFSYTPTSATSGTTFSWTRAAIATINSNVAGSGTGSISETLVNSSTAPVNVTYVYTSTANSCSNTQNVVVTVNPTPVLTSTLNAGTICNNATFSYTPTSATTGTTFAWTRATVAGISNTAGSGTGNPNETLTNTTTAPIVVTYEYTLTANGCSNTQNVTVTVNPTPVLTSTLSPSAVCSNTPFTYTPTSSTTGATFTWTRATVAGISNTAGSGSSAVNETLINTTTAPVNVTYVYTVRIGSCANPTTYNVVVTINPSPALSSLQTLSAICNNTTFTYNATSATTGTTYTWIRAAIAGINSNTSGSGTGANISEVLSNSTTSPITVTYAISLTANGCTNTQNVTVPVNPTPVLTSTLTPSAICSGSTFSYTPTSSTSGVAFNWSRAAVAGISNATTSGAGNPNEALINTTSATIDVTYVYSISVSGCGNPSTYSVAVSVKPTPILTSTLTPASICSGSTFSYTPTSSTSGASYAWSRAAVAGISNTAATGSGNPNEALTNTTTAPINVTYVYTVSANGCTNAGTYSVVVTVNPTPQLTSTLTPSAICSGTTFGYTPTSSTSGATYAWTRAAITSINGNTGGSGSGSVSEVLTNSSTSPVNVTYVYTVSANVCTNASTYSVVVTVNPTPVLTSTVSPASICSGSTFSYTPTSSTSGASYAWSRSAVAGISNAAASGAGNPSEVLTNTTSDPVDVTYVYTVSANGCTNGTTYNVVVSVNPTPQLTSTLSPASICSGSTFSYTPTSSTSGASYAWSRAAVAGISNTAATGSGNPNETLTNTTTAPINVTYVYTVSANACTNATTYNVVVTVNPTPQLTSTLTPSSICNNSKFNYSPTSGTSGAVFNWTRAAVSGISNAAASGTGDPDETLINTTPSPVSVTYVYTVSSNGCSSTTYNVVVTVNPTPQLTSTLTPSAICSGSTFSYTPTSSTSGASYAWSRAAVAGISNTAATGSGNPNETLTNTTTAPINVTYVYTVSANGCTNAGTYSVVVTVNPTPQLTSTLSPSAICSGTIFGYTPTSNTSGATYGWTRAAITSINGNTGGSGSGSVSEVLTNSSTSPVNVTYVYTVSANGCTNASTYSVVVTVNPTPVLTSTVSPASICSGSTFSYTPTSSTSGASYAWSRSAVAGISNTAASGAGNPSEVLTNTTSDPVDVTYVYTVSANGCTNGTTYNVVVSVKPTPQLTSTLSPSAICSGSTFSYTPTSSTSGASYAWSRAAVAGISNTAATGSGNPNETLTNTTTTPINVTYVYTVSANGCTNATTYNVVVTVNPTPQLTSTLTPSSICNNSKFNYSPTSGTSGAVFNWTRAAVSGISNAAASGTGDPDETLINTTPSPVSVTYVYTVSANGCSSTTYNVVVTVNPTPQLTSTLTPSAICSGSTFSYTPTSSTSGASYAWSRAAVAGISNTAATGSGNPNEALTNTTTAPINVTYVYTVSANGCTNASTYSVVVTVNPTPQLTSTLSPSAICSGTIFGYTPTSNTSGATYGWTRAAITSINGNTGGSGSGSVSELLTNSSTSPVNVTYVYTVSANGCTNASTYSVVVTVNPTPVLTSTVSPASICSGSTFSYTPTSSTSGASYAWSRSAVAGISNTAASGAGNPSEVLTNTTSDPVDVTYVYTVSANGCTNGTTYNVVVSVKPTPQLTSTLSPSAICSGSTFSYTPTSSTSGASYAWSRAAVAGISNTAATGSGNPNETLTNTTTTPINVTYVYTVSANACTNATTYNVVVTVNPTPQLTSTLTPSSICNNSKFNYSPTSGTSGAVFNWTRAAVSGISNAAASGTGDPDETLINTTPSPVSVTYVYTVSANGCSSTTYNVVVTVNPTPQLTSTLTPSAICSGSTFSYTPTSSTGGATYAWSRAAVAGISNTAATGSGNPNEALTNTTTAPINVTYVYTVSANGCTNAGTYSVVVTVNPTPQLTSTLSPSAICSGTTFGYTPTSSTGGATYGWTRSAITSINGNTGGSGSGSVSEVLTNSSTSPVNVTYVYTVSANGCTNASTYSVVVTVNPTPVLTSTVSPASICSGSTFSYTPTSSTSGASYAWSRSAVAGISNTAATGTGNPSEVLTNTTADPVDVTYVYTVSANGCTNGTTYNVVVSVKPTPQLTSTLSPASICSGSTFSYTPTSSTSGASYAWSRAAVAGISNTAATGSGNPNETLTNTTTTPINVTYVYTVSANGCTNGTTYNVVVTVNPTPQLTSTLTPSSICNNSKFNYSPTSGTSGAVFNWTRAAVSGISNAAASGTGDPDETLINTTPSPVSVTYVYTVSANGCSSTTYSVVVSVQPTPILTSTLTPSAICSGTTFSYTPTSSTGGATYAWSRAAVAGISNTAATGTGNPNEALTNTTTAPINVTYVYTVSANGCTNAGTYSVVVTVNPTPQLTSTLSPSAICSGTIFGYTPTSNTSGATFNWSRAAVGGISNAAASGTGNPNETLVNTTASPVNVTYVYTVSANGCTNASTYSVVVTVNPTPQLTSTLSPAAICNNTIFNYTPTSSTSGATYAWSRAATAGISNAAASGAGNPAETLINTTANPVNVTYIYTVSANGCTNGTSYSVIVTVNPTVNLSTTLSPAAICNNTTFSYVPASATTGATFNWSRAAVAGISNAASSGTDNPNETLVNTTANPVNVAYVYTVALNGCSYTQNVVVTVNPTPALSSTLTPAAICNNGTFNYVPTSATSGATFAWSRAAIAGISNAAANGTGNPNETLDNTTSQPISVVYTFTTTANGCSNNQNVTVVVYPTPELSSTLTPASICNNTVFSYVPTSATTGATFSWTRAAVAGISNTAGSGTGNPNETLVNTTGVPVDVTYVYTVSANSCTNPITYNVVVTVKPTPVLTSTLSPTAICSGNTFSYLPTSSTSGATFNWSRAAIAGISNAAASGTGNPNEVLVNTTSAPINVTYAYSLSANGCANGLVYNVVVTVNPSPVLTSTLTPATICNNTTFSYTPTSSTSGATFSWTRAAVAGINNIAASGNGNPNEILVNTTTSPVNVTYVYTVEANGCSNNYNVVVTVNPTPVLTSTLTPAAICNNTVFNYTPTSSTSGSSFAWTRAAVVGISNAAATGTGNPSETLVNTTDASINVTYRYVVSANGCTNAIPYDVVVTVYPTPKLTSTLTPAAICNNATFSYTPTSGTTGAAFAWTRTALPGIANAAANGTGNPNETLVNTTTAPITVTYIYTVSANGCTNPNTYNVSVVVNPAPALSSTTTPAAICSSTPFSYIPASNTVGATFAWTRAAMAGISNAAASGTGNPSEILVNTTSAPIDVVYVYTISANGCTNPVTYNVTARVNPTPVLTSTLTPAAVCNNTAFNYTPTSNTTGTVYSWSRSAIPGISNAAATGFGNINETLINTTSAPIVVTYVYTLSANGCSNTQNIVVTVNPAPALTSTLSPAAICNNSTFSYTPTSNVAGAGFAWTRAATAGINNATASGTGAISELLVNTTASPVNVTYTYTIIANGCTNPYTYDVVVRVNPTPVLTSILVNGTICNNTTFSYVPTSSSNGTSFSWTRDAVPAINGGAPSSGTGNINELLVNNSNQPANAIYRFTLSANGCTNPTIYTVVVTVNPTAQLTTTLNPAAICNNTVFSYVPMSDVSGATFTWSRAAVPGISNASTSGAGTVSEVLTNVTPNPIDVTYRYIVSANGCTNSSAYDVVVRVNPTPILNTPLTATPVCNNSVFDYIPLSVTQGVVFTWNRATVAGIGNVAATGTGNPHETLVNTTTSPIDVVYTYTLIANGCSNTQNVTVRVFPTPLLTSTLAPGTICNNSTFNYTPTSSTTGATFSWSRAAVAGITNIAAAGNANPAEVLVNTTNAPIDVTYVYTVAANGCVNPASYNVVVRINPTPQLTSTLTPAAICNNSTFSYTPSSNTTGATFAWTRPAVAGISNPASSGSGNPNEVLVNTTTAPVNVVYVYTVTANGCTNPAIYSVVVTVYPMPQLTSTLTPAPICNNATFNYTPTSSTTGATFSWTRAAVSGISNLPASGSGNPAEVLVNTTVAPVNVTYVYTVTANGCSNPSTYNVVVTVYPTPQLTSTLTPAAICNNSTFSYTPTSSTAGATYSWTRAAVTGISNITASGTGSISEVLNNMTTTPVSVTYVYTVTANGCTNSSTYSVVVTVNPTPQLTSTLTPLAICNNSAFSYTPTSSTTGAVFNWSRAAVAGISNTAASGTGNPNEVLVNTTTAPVNVTYVYTVSINGCTNPGTYSVVVTVNPTPQLTSTLTPTAICNNTTFSYLPTSSTSGTTFSWSRAAVTGISNVAATGAGNPAEVLVNTTAAPITVTYVYTLSANGCANPASYNVIVTVYPTPQLTSTLTPAAICNNGTFSYTPTSSTTGATFGWSRAAVAGISNVAATGTGNVSEVLTNTTTVPVNVTYTYTVSANGCANATTYSVVVTVNPTPVLTSTLAPAAICNNTTFSYIPTSSTTGATFGWSRAAVAGISNAAATGIGNVSEVLTNTTTVPVNVTYVYTVSANGCANATTYNVVVTVYPTTTTANAGTDIGPVNTISVVMAANQPVVGNGAWTQLTGPNTATVSNINAYNATISGLQPGTYTFKWAITSPWACGTTNDTVKIIVNTPPVAINDTAVTNMNVPVLIDIPFNDYDVDGTISRSTVNVTLPPANGSVVINATTGEATYTPNLNYTGVDTFKYTIRDNDNGLSNVATVRITINKGPIAIDDLDSTMVNTPVTVSILNNDVPGNSALDAPTTTSVAQPKNGTVIIGSDGKAIYTPNTGYYGIDSFTYTVKDLNKMISNVATARILIFKPPVAVNDDTVTAMGTPVVINISKNDTAFGRSLNLASIKLQSQPKNGTVTVNANGTATYRPNAGFYGVDSFRYSIFDTKPFESNIATVRIRIPQNRPDLKVTKRIVTQQKDLAIGKDVVFEIEVENISATTATKVVVTDILADNLGGSNVRTSVQSGKANYNVATKTVTWTLDSLRGGQKSLMTLTVQLTSGGLIKNSASGKSNETDGDTTNNASTVSMSLTDDKDDLFIPNIITPNGDGKNDKFVILGLDAYPGTEVSIFNRWGNMVYTSADYKNNWSGDGLVEGTYFYTVSVKTKAGVKKYSGWVELLRSNNK